MRWTIATAVPSVAQALSRELGLTPLAGRVLAARGLQTAEQARQFLSPQTTSLLDPFLLTDMRQAADRLTLAIKQKEPILLYGDYDVDGTSALVILKTVITLAGGTAECFVPHRLKDGYGMKSEVVDEAAQKGVRLIISVDTGIRANEVVSHASSLGVDVIVTDHHLPEAELPAALAVVNPNRPDCAYPEKNLCGAGVALKLAQALLVKLDWEPARRIKLLDSLLKLAAIATVADVVPLTGENRVIVKRGLEGLRHVASPGLRALLDVSGIEPGDAPSAGQVGFQIAPRINAAGRMASANEVVELLTTKDEVRARTIAAGLDSLNRDRRETEEKIQQEILELCLAQPVTDDEFALVFAGEGWHRGVVGIVASRVVARHHRPVFVLGIENGLAIGSGRSIRAFHLLDALESMPELFQKFGGHRQAAGLTMDANNLDEFRAAFRAYAAKNLTAADLEPEIELDAAVELHEITDQSVGELLMLNPFGMGNPAPTVAVNGVKVLSCDIKKDKHLFLRLEKYGRTIRAKAWSFAARTAELEAGKVVDVALQFEDDSYSAARGYSPWQAIVRDVRSAKA